MLRSEIIFIQKFDDNIILYIIKTYDIGARNDKELERMKIMYIQ